MAKDYGKRNRASGKCGSCHRKARRYYCRIHARKHAETMRRYRVRLKQMPWQWV